ncbi:serpin family protein [Pseudonocardiaceae bacterium YIM PH 21723]|nr:serpin family protein [Pseudonocardiaceae bacterium YIM PH 21723]
MPTSTFTGHLRFALHLHRALGVPVDQPTCVSPVSVASALGLVGMGAGGRTRAEVDAALGGLDAHAALLAEATRPYDEDNAVLAVANSLWIRPDLPVRQDYLRQLADRPGAALREAPFATDPDGARDLINADIARTTRDLIPKLLDSVHPATMAMLVNALYLKVGWRHRFPKTTQAVFHAPGGDREVPTMVLTETVGYARRDRWQVVELPAAGDVVATILLPDGELDESAVDEALLEVDRQEIELRLPRLSVSSRFELIPALRALGVDELFTENADLSELADAALYVSDAVHESVLKLDEDGLEGAAATAFGMRLAMFREPRPVATVRVDRPFLLLIRHRGTGAVYFLARVTDPG